MSIPPNIAHQQAHIAPKAANLGDLLRLYTALPKQRTELKLKTPFQHYFYRFGHNAHWHLILTGGLIGYTMHYYFHFRHQKGKEH